MKPELHRIETTLEQLANSQATDSPPGESARHQDIDTPSFSMAVKPFPADKHQGKAPSLPKIKPSSFSNHRHGTNPALAMNLLKEIEEVVAGWQQELKKVLKQIQDIYIDGPIVDGWLESHLRESQEAQEIVRLAQDDRLMDYVKERINSTDIKVSYESPRTGYRLCGLDSDGQSWSRNCPPDQVPSVSVAIARYQKLRQLLNRKEELETRLSQLSETLVVMHAHLSKD
ncbi:MAG: hypothetical protein F6K21_05440 [Symploca sp. SIO2D2]|nr:hypothetical protein [Symploca sp. SIO2D2]